MVYEVSILVDVPDSDRTLDNGTVTRHQVDVSFFDTESNDTFINFGDIPLPVETNVSGHILTEITPYHIGAVKNIGEVLKSLPFTGSIVNITESDTSYVHVTRENVTQEEQEIHFANNTDLSKLPILENVLLPDSFDDAFNSVSDNRGRSLKYEAHSASGAGKLYEISSICLAMSSVIWRYLTFIN